MRNEQNLTQNDDDATFYDAACANASINYDLDTKWTVLDVFSINFAFSRIKYLILNRANGIMRGEINFLLLPYWNGHVTSAL